MNPMSQQSTSKYRLLVLTGLCVLVFVSISLVGWWRTRGNTAYAKFGHIAMALQLYIDDNSGNMPSNEQALLSYMKTTGLHELNLSDYRIRYGLQADEIEIVNGQPRLGKTGQLLFLIETEAPIDARYIKTCNLRIAEKMLAH